MIDKKIIKEVMSQHFKIEDDYTYDNVVDALDNYSDRLASKLSLNKVDSYLPIRDSVKWFAEKMELK